MLEVLASDEFSEWYAALDDATAEEVAEALELIEKLGPGKAAPGSSEWLLWYEYSGGPIFFLALDEWSAFRDYTRRVIEHLESPRFVARLRSLSARDAASIGVALAKIKTISSLGRRGLSIAGKSGLPGLLPDQYAELRRWYRGALELTGLDETDVPAHSLALREIALRALSPGVRLLYGVNARQGVAFVALGERLDRSFYGDSVRRAERLWKQFLERSARAGGPARPR